MKGPAPGQPSAMASEVAASASCKLGFFQQSMLLWGRIHPYVAVHALRLRGAARPDDWCAAATAACKAAGLGRLHIFGTDRYRFDGDVAVEVDRRAAANDPLAAVARVADAAMNRPFASGPHSPFRWCMFDEAAGAAHWIVLAYHHVVADAAAIEALLQRILVRYWAALEPAAGREPGLAPAPLRAAADAVDDPFRGAVRRTGVLATLRRAVRMYRAFRAVHKMQDERGRGDQTHSIVRAGSVELYSGLRAACAQRGVGMNDALLAALCGAIKDAAPDRVVSRKRRKIALGTVLSGRRLAPQAWENRFGVCLTDGLLLIDDPDVPDDELLREVARQGSELKKNPLAFAALSMLRLFLVRRIWPLFMVRQERRSYRRVFPLCGGVSTYVASASQFGRAAAQVLDYVRVCPPGPATPIVLAPTVYDGRLSLALTCRESCLSAARAEQFLCDIERRLSAFLK